jgi:hypothetical protein
MKINIDIDNNYNNGDSVRLLSNVSNGFCLFVVGHEFKIEKIDRSYDKYYLIDKDGDKLILYSSSEMTKIISTEQAKKKFYDKKEYDYFVSFFTLECPHRKEEYSHRDIYDVCSKQQINSYLGAICEPNNNCIQYYKDFKKDKQIDKYIRKVKLLNIIK